jgi:hypothetical protein
MDTTPRGGGAAAGAERCGKERRAQRHKAAALAHGRADKVAMTMARTRQTGDFGDLLVTIVAIAIAKIRVYEPLARIAPAVDTRVCAGAAVEVELTAVEVDERIAAAEGCEDT